VTVDEAREALCAVVPNLAEREAKGQFEVFPNTDWCMAGGCFDMKRILDGWAEKYRQGLQRGYAGLRVSGDTAWLESANWESFCQYEQSIDSAIAGSNILVLCTYSLDRCGPYELLDVVRNHRFTVSDNGIGVDPAVIPRLFSAFEQGERSSAFGGLGLGLAIAKGIVEAHGGRISVESEGQGKGATFTVKLPLSDEVSSLLAPDALNRESTQEQLHADRPLRILLVEDHPDIARMMARLLIAEGHEVVTAYCIRTALAAADGGPFDVLVSDLGLPDGSGHDLMRRLTAAHKPIKGIAISGYGAAGDIEQSRKAGFAEHIIKPVAFDALHQALIRITADARNGPIRARP